MAVIEKVMEASAADFREEGFDEEVLQKLKALWTQSLEESNVTSETHRLGSTQPAAVKAEPQTELSAAAKDQIDTMIEAAVDDDLDRLTAVLQQHCKDLEPSAPSIRLLQKHGWTGVTFLSKPTADGLYKLANELITFTAKCKIVEALPAAPVSLALENRQPFGGSAAAAIPDISFSPLAGERPGGPTPSFSPNPSSRALFAGGKGPSIPQTDGIHDAERPPARSSGMRDASAFVRPPLPLPPHPRSDSLLIDQTLAHSCFCPQALPQLDGLHDDDEQANKRAKFASSSSSEDDDLGNAGASPAPTALCARSNRHVVVRILCYHTLLWAGRAAAADASLPLSPSHCPRPSLSATCSDRRPVALTRCRADGMDDEGEVDGEAEEEAIGSDDDADSDAEDDENATQNLVLCKFSVPVKRSGVRFLALGLAPAWPPLLPLALLHEVGAAGDVIW